ncbi:MAG: VWA domain-containing protein [Crocinitomicaceae bacterium]
MSDSTHKYHIKELAIAIIIWEVIFWAIFFSVYYYLQDLNNFRYENEHMLWGLCLVPLVVLGYFVLLKWKNKSLRNLAAEKLLPYLTAPVSTLKSFTKFFLFRNGLAFLILAMANPQYGKGKSSMVAEGIEIIFAIDISNSMRALDLDPTRDRLTVAKMSIDRMLHSLHGDKVGIVVFAGDAHLQVPVTGDYRAVRMYMQSIRPEMMTNQGTDIGHAIDKCIQSFDMENGVNKTIIIMSDGENHEEAAEEMAQAAYENKIIVNTVGMGTENETTIPEVKNGQIVGLKKDYNGQTVYTKINEDMLLSVAQAGGGSYTRAEGNFVNLEGLLEEIKKIEKTEMESSLYTDYDDQYHWFLAVGLIFILAEFLFTERRSGVVYKLQEYDA